MNALQTGAATSSGDLDGEEYTNRTILDDLQLAAELGKTLLERNKELENALKHTQSVVEDQLQEIEYLTKQSVALREVNDSRLRIYEQLEVSIHDLERANHRLLLDNASEKKRVKSQATTIEGLEVKNEELLSMVDELRLQLDLVKRKLNRSCGSEVGTPIASPNAVVLRHVGVDLVSAAALDTPDKNRRLLVETSTPNTEKKTDSDGKRDQESLLPQDHRNDGNDDYVDGNQVLEADENIEEVSKLLSQLREYKTSCAKEQRKVTELEEQLSTLTQQNQALENQIIRLHHRDEEIKSVHEEFSLLEEVRQGQTCSRCLRNMESPEREKKDTEDTSNVLEDDDPSILEPLMTSSPQYHSAYALDVQDYPNSPPNINTNNQQQEHQHPQQQQQQPKNHYREFVEKYEALFEDHVSSNSHNHNVINQQQRATRKNNNKGEENFASLQEELRNSGEYGNMSGMIGNREEEGSEHEDGVSEKRNEGLKKGGNGGKVKAASSHTPTDFSEAETSSSGFADETSTKSTQTDGVVGSLLCAITDGDDCKFSIYDEVSPIDSRFRKRPEYRELFKEIFEVLKKAAENNDNVLPNVLEQVESSIDSSSLLMMSDMLDSTAASEVDYRDMDDAVSVQSSTISLPVSLTCQREPPTLQQVEDDVKRSVTEKSDRGRVEDEKKQRLDEEKPSETSTHVSGTTKPEEPVLRPLIRQSFDFIHVERRKRSSSRRKQRHTPEHSYRSDSPITHIIGSPKISYSSRPSSGRRRRGEIRNNGSDATPTPTNSAWTTPTKGAPAHQPPSATLTTPTQADLNETWNGNSMQFWASRGARAPSPTPSQGSEQGGAIYEFKPSVASQEIRKLKSLDKSYAEVLKLGEVRKRVELHHQHQRQRGVGKGAAQQQQHR